VRGIPQPAITWYKNGDEFLNTNKKEQDQEEELKEKEQVMEKSGKNDREDKRRVRVHTKGRELEISMAEVDDAARYTCIARNIAGEIEKSYNLQVYGNSLYSLHCICCTTMSAHYRIRRQMNDIETCVLHQSSHFCGLKWLRIVVKSMKTVTLTLVC